MPTTTRFFVFSCFLFLHLFGSSQISVSFGVSNKFQTDNKYDNDGSPWFGGYKESTILEHYIFDSYTLGIDLQRKEFNMMIDLLWSMDKLTVSSYSSYAYGYQNGTKNTQLFQSHSVNYGYLGFKVSPQRALTLNKKFDLLIGPTLQFQWKLYEREYDHFDSTYYRSSFYNPWTDSYPVFESSSSSTDEFDGMNLTNLAARVGITVNPRITIDKFRFILNFSGGMGFTSRMVLANGSGAFEDKIYGFLEVGAKFAYQLGEGKTISPR